MDDGENSREGLCLTIPSVLVLFLIFLGKTGTSHCLFVYTPNTHTHPHTDTHTVVDGHNVNCDYVSFAAPTIKYVIYC